MPAPSPLPLSESDRTELRRRAAEPAGGAAGGAAGSASGSASGIASTGLRARIVLLAAEGVPAVRIAERLGVSRQTVAAWTSRYRARGLTGLADRPRSGRPRIAPPQPQPGAPLPGVGAGPAPSLSASSVIEAIRLAGRLSRVEIAERTGLTQQTVSRIVRQLIGGGLVVESAAPRPASGAAAAAGKPRTPLRLRADAGHALGLHIDPDVVTCVLTDLTGRVLRRTREPVSREQPAAELVDRVTAAARELAGGAGRVLGAGIAVPGPIDPASGVVLDPPLMRAWRDVPLRDLLAERLGLPVVLEKDATAATIGERWIGKAARARDFVYLYLGAGVGAGMILNGDVYRGLTANAGEFGRLLSGPWEEPRELAHGVLALVDLLDLGLVVLGGPAMGDPATAASWLRAVNREVNTHSLARRARGPVAVERSLVTTEAAAVGAASSVFHAAFAPRR